MERVTTKPSHIDSHNTCIQTHTHLIVHAASVGRDNAELLGKNVGQFSSVTIATSSGFLYGVIVITGSEQVPKDQLWHVHPVVFVDLRENT